MGLVCLFPFLEQRRALNMALKHDSKHLKLSQSPCRDPVYQLVTQTGRMQHLSATNGLNPARHITVLPSLAPHNSTPLNAVMYDNTMNFL